MSSKYTLEMWIKPVVQPGEVRNPVGPYWCVDEINCTDDPTKAGEYSWEEALDVSCIWFNNGRPTHIVIREVKNP